MMNRYKYLELVDRGHGELQMKVRNIVQEAVTKTILKKKKCKRGKWLSQKALEIAVEKKRSKGKGERKRYTQLNTEFQRTARRDKEVLLSEQCKEIKKRNRLGKTRDFFK